MKRFAAIWVCIISMAASGPLSAGSVRTLATIFVSWIGDHSPRHVHVYRDGNLVVKWDLENSRTMEGKATRRVLQHIRSLVEEGRL